MGPGSFEASAGQLDDPCLDHHATGAERGVAVTEREHHAADPRAALDAAPLESGVAGGCAAALAPTLERDRALDLLSEAAADHVAARAEPAELRLEVVIAHYGRASRVGLRRTRKPRLPPHCKASPSAVDQSTTCRVQSPSLPCCLYKQRCADKDLGVA
jgi:hypothetical protein